MMQLVPTAPCGTRNDEKAVRLEVDDLAATGNERHCAGIVPLSMPSRRPRQASRPSLTIRSANYDPEEPGERNGHISSPPGTNTELSPQ